MTNRIEADFIVPEALSERRLDQAMAELMPEHSRSRLQGWIRDGGITVNGKPHKPKDKVIFGDVIRVGVSVEQQDIWQPEAIPLDIVHEDEHLLVINKSAGMVVHPAAGNYSGTLVNALLHYLPALDILPRAGIVHRLDKDTTGLMVVAKSLEAHTSLVGQLQARTVGREYEAIVTGEMTGGGTVDAPVGRHAQHRTKMAVSQAGKPAVTHYRVLERLVGHTFIQCQLETGRTHQIRVHMAHIGHPLVGDPVYGGRLRYPRGAGEALRETLRGFGRQALHARRLTLRHPATDEVMSWERDMPADMACLLERLRALGSPA